MTIIVLLLIAIIGYVLLCVAKPTRRCGKCAGGGLRDVKRMKFCKKCHGSGKVTRLGAQIINRSATKGIRYIKERGEQ